MHYFYIFGLFLRVVGKEVELRALFVHILSGVYVLWVEE